MLAEDVPQGSMLFGFDPTDPANESLVFAANGDATKEPSQCYAEPFPMYTWAVKRVTLTDDATKEQTPHARLVLLSKDGESLSFVSVGALESMDLIRALRGDGPFDQPLPIIVTESKTRAGFRVFKLIIQQERGRKEPAK